MKIAIVVTAIIGTLLIVGAWNKTVIQYARKIGKIFSPLSGLSFTMSRLSEKDKDSIARLWLLWFGGLLLIAVILGVIFRVGE